MVNGEVICKDCTMWKKGCSETSMKDTKWLVGCYQFESKIGLKKAEERKERKELKDDMKMAEKIRMRDELKSQTKKVKNVPLEPIGSKDVLDPQKSQMSIF